MRKTTPEQIERWRKQYESGLSCDRIAAMAGVSAGGVHYVLKLAGVRFRARRQYPTLKGGPAVALPGTMAQAARQRQELQAQTPQPATPPCGRCQSRPALPGLLQGRVPTVWGEPTGQSAAKGLCGECYQQQAAQPARRTA